MPKLMSIATKGGVSAPNVVQFMGGGPSPSASSALRSGAVADFSSTACDPGRGFAGWAHAQTDHAVTRIITANAIWRPIADFTTAPRVREPGRPDPAPARSPLP